MGGHGGVAATRKIWKELWTHSGKPYEVSQGRDVGRVEIDSRGRKQGKMPSAEEGRYRGAPRAGLGKGLERPCRGLQQKRQWFPFSRSVLRRKQRKGRGCIPLPKHADASHVRFPGRGA